MRNVANRNLGIAVAVIALIAIIGTAVLSSWTVPQRDPNAPEGVVQGYLQAVFEHRSADAVSYLDPATKCTAENFDMYMYDAASRVDLVDSSVRGDAATVRVSIEHDSGDPFGGRWPEPQVFQLHRSSGQWRITGQPWPVWACQKVMAP